MASPTLRLPEQMLETLQPQDDLWVARPLENAAWIQLSIQNSPVDARFRVLDSQHKHPTDRSSSLILRALRAHLGWTTTASRSQARPLRDHKSAAHRHRQIGISPRHMVRRVPPFPRSAFPVSWFALDLPDSDSDSPSWPSHPLHGSESGVSPRGSMASTSLVLTWLIT